MRKLPLALAAFMAGVPLHAFAHPHIFAEARLEVVAGDDGAIRELRNIWRFDEMFSASVLMDFDKNTNLQLDEDELAEIGTVVRDSLADYSYYTSISMDGKAVAVAKPDVIHVAYQDGQILMFFSVKPETAMPLKGKLTFGVWDPTLYTAIDFVTDDDLAIEGSNIDACKRAVIRPDPDEVIAQNQTTLTDAFFDDPMGTDMTKLFATRLELTCE